MKKILFVLALLLTGTSVNAQQVVTLAWDYDKVPTEVATYTQAVSIDGAVQTAVPTCVAKGTTATTCSIPAPSLATGTHTVRIDASRNGVMASTIIQGLGAANGPSNPSNINITITVTVKVGQ